LFAEFSAALRIETIESLASLTLLHQQSRTGENPQVVRDGGLGEGKAFCELGHVETFAR
jgi:hypothetical protein